MTTNQRSREAAYADLVSGLIDARVDVASDRFDAELEAAEASGRLDPATARLLRWWQRESVRAVTEHARTTVPATLVALEKAEKEAREALYRADAAWTTARGVSARSTYAAEPVAPPEPVTPTPAVTDAPAAEPQATTPTAQPVDTETLGPETSSPAPAPAPAAVEAPVAPEASEAPVTPPPPPAPWSATVTPPAPPTAPDPATPWGPTLEPPNYPGAPVDATDPTGRHAATGPAVSYEPGPDEAPSVVDLTARDELQDSSATPASGRRRTLLAGLTVLPRTD